MHKTGKVWSQVRRGHLASKALDQEFVLSTNTLNMTFDLTARCSKSGQIKVVDSASYILS